MSGRVSDAAAKRSQDDERQSDEHWETEAQASILNKDEKTMSF